MPRKIKESIVFQKNSNTFSNKDLLKQHPYYKNDMREARKLYKSLSFLLSTPKKHERKNYQKWSFQNNKQQKCIPKLRFGLDKEKHRRFLEEYLTQQKKNDILEKPYLFSNTKDIHNYIEEYKSKMTDKHFKFIISPESSNVDCEVLVKTLVARMEKITGLQFDWLSAVHTNTDHTHAHLLINGVDKTGRDVDCFRGTFLKQSIREMSAQICTELVGERTKEQIQADIRKLPTVSRFCSIDNQIEKYEIKNTDLKSNAIFSSKIISQDDTMYCRLCFLSDLGFAQKIEGSKKTFLLENDWALKLKASGRYNSFLKARKSLFYTSVSDLQFFTKDTKEEISGEVTKLFVMNDEDSWDNAIVIENKKTKKAYYVPLYGEPKDKLLNTQVTCSSGLTKQGSFMPIIKVNKWNQTKNNNLS